MEYSDRSTSAAPAFRRRAFCLISFAALLPRLILICALVLLFAFTDAFGQARPASAASTEQAGPGALPFVERAASDAPDDYRLVGSREAPPFAATSFDDGGWALKNLLPGVDGTILSVLKQENFIYAGGRFAQAGGTEARSITRFNLDSRKWESLGLECTADCEITTLLLDGGFLYVGGALYIEQGEDEDGEPLPPLLYNIARYDLQNKTWDYLGTTGGGNSIRALYVHEDMLYAGGQFSSINNVSARNIARYELSSQTWAGLGSGISAEVYAFHFTGSIGESPLLLIGSGLEGTIGNQEITGLNTFRPDASPGEVANDQAWGSLGDIRLESFADEGYTGYISAIEETETHIFISGFFDVLNNQQVFSLASYAPETQDWRGFRDGNFDIIEDMAVHETQVYVITPDMIDTAREDAAMLRINPVLELPDWELLERGFDASVSAVISGDGLLYVAGGFKRASSHTNLGGIAGYEPDGGYWFPVGTFWGDEEAIVSGGDIHSSVYHQDAIIAGGDFSNAGGNEVNRIAAYRMETQAWEAFGGGFADGQVFTLASDGTRLFAGGSFTRLADNTEAGGIAVYDTLSQSWQPFTGGVLDDDDQPGTIYELLIHENQLFAGGQFTSAGGTEASHIARYDFEAESWLALGAGTEGAVRSLLMVDSTLYVGGQFSSAGELDDTAYLAGYRLPPDTRGWFSLEAGIPPGGSETGVYAMAALQNSRLFVAGSFAGTAAETSTPNMAAYNLRYESEDENMQPWFELPGTPDGPVFSLRLYGDNLFAGGNFSRAGNALNANNIVRYNWAENKWLNLDEGVNAPVYAITPYADDIYLGGGFSSPASGFIRWKGVSGFAGGDGSAERPYLVNSTQALARVGYFFDAHFLQSEDLFYPDQNNLAHSRRISTAAPLASAELPFRGVFDGNDKLILNWTSISSNESPKGFFTATEGAVLRGVHIHKMHLRSSSADNVGGLVGRAHNTRIEEASVTGHVHGRDKVGGLIGELSGNSSVARSYYSQNIGSSYQNSIDGEVRGRTSIGGFAGLVTGDSRIENSFAFGKVSSSDDSKPAGGFAGTTDNNAEIERSYASVEINPDANGRGFIGQNESPATSISFTYWNEGLIPSNDDFAIGLTTAQMRAAENFEALDFETIWDIRPGSSFPFLRSDNSLGAVGPESQGALVAAGPRVNGPEGWRYFGLAFNESSSLYEFTRELTTQGFPGADLEGNISNVWFYQNEANDWQPVPSLRNLPLEENAFGMFVFLPPLEDEIDLFPIVPMYRNPTQERTTPVLGFELNAFSETASGGTWTLMANNNLWPIQSDAFELEGIKEVVYVYDPSLPGYISWNGEAGDLENGIIQPFQGFFMETIAEEASFGLPEEALVKESDATLKTAPESQNPAPSLRLHARSEQGFESSAWISFVEGGHAKSARKLKPMDRRAFAELAFTSEEEQAYDIFNIELNEATPERLYLPLSLQQYDDDWQRVAADFSISWEGSGEFPEGWQLALYDARQDAYHDLSSSTELPYTSATADGEPGLFLVVEPQVSAPIGPTAETQLPETLRLDQNYPNPFNPSTTISFALPEARQVRLEVFNLVGQRVAVLANSVMQPGEHEVSFDASTLSSGLYLYRLQAGQQVLTHKMMLLK